jgi:MFS family permease
MAEQIKPQTPFARVLANRNFRLLWIGGPVSVLGSQFSLIALPWLVLQLTGDPQVLGLVLALAGLARAIFMLYGGVVTDRLSPRRILIACDWINFVLSGMIAALVFSGSIQIWMVYVFALLTGILSGFVIPAATSMTPRILPGEDLQSGNSISMGSVQLMGFIGPALAGVIIGSYSRSAQGIVLAFAFDALTFAFSAVLLARMRVAQENRAGAVQSESAWTSIVTAARFIVHQESLRLMFIVLVPVNFLFVGPLLVGIPVLADQRLAEGAAAFGLLMSAYAGGNLAGYLLAGALPRPTGRRLSAIFVALIAAFGIVLAAFGWIQSTWLDFALCLALVVGNGYIALILITWIQQSTPRELLGRVMSMVMLASMALIPFSQAISGTVIKWNTTALFALAGGLLVLVAAWMAFQPGLRSLSDQMLDAAAAE